ncbi:MAG: hypothetical protein WA634_02045 [Silvibacterium sp.]
MRFVMILTACLGAAVAQPNQDADSNMSCVERLQMPLYPPLAVQARISGSVTATVAVGSSSSVQTTLSRGAHDLLNSAVEGALHSSTFRKTCIGKSVTLVFNFVIDEKLRPGRFPQRASFGYPNQFWITVPPRLVEP